MLLRLPAGCLLSPLKLLSVFIRFHSSPGNENAQVWHPGHLSLDSGLVLDSGNPELQYVTLTTVLTINKPWVAQCLHEEES